MGRIRGIAALVVAVLALSGCARPWPGFEALAPASPAAGAPGEAGSPGAPGTPSPSPSPQDPDGALERRIVDLVNLDRASAGLPPLALDEELAMGAREWARAMAGGAGLAHDPGLAVPAGASVAGENVAFRTTDGDVARGLQAQFMRSEGHRRNVLDQAYDRVGIGVVSAGGRTWVTQRFAG